MAQRVWTASWIGAGVLASGAFAQQIRTQPANGGSLPLASAPSTICAGSITDQAGGACLEASTNPTLGMLYPMSPDLNVDPSNGRVGIGTTQPMGALHVEGSDGVLSTGAYIGTAWPALGAGVRMHWWPNSGTFRAGRVSADQWDYPNVGVGSVAMGIDTIARSNASTALGYATRARGQYTLSAGYQSDALGEGAVALGIATHADSYACVAVGRNNVGGGSNFSWVATDPLFEVGSGDFVTRGNAFTVLKNGNVGIGTAHPELPLHIEITPDASPTGGGSLAIGALWAQNLVFDSNEIMARNGGVVSTLSLNANGGNVNISAAGSGRVAIGHGTPNFTLDVNGTAGKPGGGSWSVASDARLKKNVRELEGALDKLLELHGVSFEYIDPEAIGELAGERIGFLAQEVERVFPDWVGTKDDGMLFLTVRGFEALAVEALRDLATRNRELEERNAALQEQLTRELATRDRQLVELRALVQQVAADQASMKLEHAR